MKQKTEIKKVKSLNDADTCLSALSEINSQLEIIKGKKSKAEYEKLKVIEKFDEEAEPILLRKKKLLQALEDFAVKNRSAVFAGDQSIKLKNGRIGFQKSKRALLKRRDNPYAEQDIAKAIFYEIGESCAQIKFELKKEEIKRQLTEQQLEKFGLYIYQNESFFAESVFGVRF